MFNGTLGTWNTTMLDSELKDNENTVCLRPYPIARVDEAIKKKQLKRLVILGVLGEANESKWGAPYFAQPKAKKIVPDS